MPKYKATLLDDLKRRLPALFSKRNRRADKYWVSLISGLALVVLSVFHGTDGHSKSDEFRGDKGKTYRCELEKISDGDTVTAICDRKKLRIRLAGIDAPETGQKPFGAQARKALQDRLPRNFEMRYHGKDYYQRSLGTLYDLGRNINLLMVSDGYAFAYDGKDTPSEYREAEKQAQRYRRGFWKESKPPENPKVWRRHHL